MRGLDWPDLPTWDKIIESISCSDLINLIPKSRIHKYICSREFPKIFKYQLLKAARCKRVNSKRFLLNIPPAQLFKWKILYFSTIDHPGITYMQLYTFYIFHLHLIIPCSLASLLVSHCLSNSNILSVYFFRVSEF